MYYNIQLLKTEYTKRAFIYYTNVTMPYVYEYGTEHASPDINKHSMYWESVELVRILNNNGYLVDYSFNEDITGLDFSQYDLIMSHDQNLKDIKSKCKKVFYCTANYFKFWNKQEFNRLTQFNKRNNLNYSLQRQSENKISPHDYCDYITYFGTEFLLNNYPNLKAIPHQLNISCVSNPQHNLNKININKIKNNFFYMCGGGQILKGMDWVLEYFHNNPQYKLFLAADLEVQEPEFSSIYATPLIKNSPNIHYLGWQDVTSQHFFNLASHCMFCMNFSCTEGGPGATAQLLHYGMIPIVTKSACVRGEVFGKIIYDFQFEDASKSITNSINELHSLSEKELLEKMTTIQHFAKNTHTREKYSESVDRLVKRYENNK